MRETDLWERLDQHLGAGYSHVWARQTVLPELGQTVEEALVARVPFKQIWHAVWLALELPATDR